MMVWKTIAAVLAILCGMLFALWQQAGHVPATATLSDPRLIGTWVSDRDRTLQDLQAQWELSEERLEEFGQLLGRLRVTFTDADVTLSLDEFVETMPYDVVAVDRFSVVIQESPQGQTEPLETSSFTMIHFDGNDAYWVMSELGGFPEYYRRAEGG